MPDTPEKKEFGMATVTDLCDEHGYGFLDQYVARAFAELTGKPETDVLYLLRRAARIRAKEERGKGKYDRAVKSACMALAIGWLQAPHCIVPASNLLIGWEPPSAYAILVWRELNPRS